MSDADGSGFGKFIPGFDFMQNLARQTSGGLVQGCNRPCPSCPTWAVGPLRSTSKTWKSASRS